MSAAPKDVNIALATTASEIEITRNLIREYGESLGIDLGYQNFEAELRTLPGDYAPPWGALLLVRDGEGDVGCVALRPLSSSVCEMKRLYVRPRCRGRGIARRLIAAVLDEARRTGYLAIRLDTLPTMSAARALYKSLGFLAIAPYYESPIKGTAFLELDLTKIPDRTS
jgi:ribosomal protein S18 acetylase RimI-like enzyme